MKNLLSKISKKLALPLLAFALALVVSGLLVAFSDSEVLALKSNPLEMLAKALAWLSEEKANILEKHLNANNQDVARLIT
jgi:hypothetical protein